jgi:high-affinity Fe2+/Pb2+ permease
MAQWLVLRRQTPRVRHWVPTTTAALAATLAVSSLLVDASGLKFASLAGVMTFVVIAGFAFGAMTNWPLRRYRPAAGAQ